MQKPAVSFRGVKKSFGTLQALKGIDLEIPQGSFFGLLGHNGAGKSTLINAMAGLVKLDAGEIQVMGHDVIHAYRQSRRALGVVPQELVDEPFFSVRELLNLQSGYFGLYGKAQRHWIDALLERLSLIEKTDVKMHQLSGGMKRRVLIAMALVHRPQVLVLDEPTAGVDVALRQNLWQFASELHQQGMTIILTTHYLEEAEALCDQIAIMHQGQLIAVEQKETLLARYPWKHIELWGIGAVRQPLEGYLMESRGAGHWLFRVPRDTSMSEFLTWVQQSHIQLQDLKVQDVDLEQVFLTLTGAQT